MDKLSKTPSRLEPLGLGMRAAAGAASGAVVARRAPEFVAAGDPAVPFPPAAPRTKDVVACVAVALAATVGTAYLGERWRGLLAVRVGNDYAGAGLEDAIGITLGWLSTRAPSRHSLRLCG